MPEISVVIPVYKAENFLSKCVESILHQTFTDLEIICVDDGSPDRSGEILDEYTQKDARIRVIHQPNAGIGGARNTGMNAAQGKYLMFCDSDDWFEPNICEVLRNLMISRDVDMTMSSHFMELWGGSPKLVSLSTAGTIPGGYYKNCRRFFPVSSGMVWNKMLKMEIIRQYHLQFPEIRKGEDVCFMREYLLASTKGFYCLNKNLYHYSVRPSSLTDGNAAPITLDSIEEFNLTYDFLQRYGLWEKHKKLLLYAFFGHARKAWMVFGTTHPHELFEKMRSFLNHVNLADWGNSYTNRLVSAIRQNDDAKSGRLLHWWLYRCPAYGSEYFILIIYRLVWSARTHRKYQA